MATKTEKRATKPRPRKHEFAECDRPLGHDPEGNPIVPGCVCYFPATGDTGLVTYVEGDAIVYRVIGSSEERWAKSVFGTADQDGAGNALVIADAKPAARFFADLADAADRGQFVVEWSNGARGRLSARNEKAGN